MSGDSLDYIGTAKGRQAFQGILACDYSFYFLFEINLKAASQCASECVFVSVFVLQKHLCMIELPTLTHMWTMYMVAVYIFRYVYMWSSTARVGGVMCFPDSQSPQGAYRTHNNPQSNTGTQDWINGHTKNTQRDGESDRNKLCARPLNAISPLRPPQRHRPANLEKGILND